MTSKLFTFQYNPDNITEVEDFFDQPQKQRIFLISPVNKSTQEDVTKISEYLENLRETGKYVYYPNRHTLQENPSILEIMNTNKNALKQSGEVHIFYKEESVGSIIDLGMTFINEKKLVISNLAELKYLTDDGISLFVKKYSKNMSRYVSKVADNFIEDKKKIKSLEQYVVAWNGFNKLDLFRLGMAFGLDLPITLVNEQNVPKTNHKSPENFLLELHYFYSKNKN